MKARAEPTDWSLYDPHVCRLAADGSTFKFIYSEIYALGCRASEQALRTRICNLGIRLSRNTHAHLGWWTPERLQKLEELHETMTWPNVANAMTSLYGHPLTTAACMGAYHKLQVRLGHRHPQPPKVDKTDNDLALEAEDELDRGRLCRRPQVDRASMSLTARLMGDPPPGRMSWPTGR